MAKCAICEKAAHFGNNVSHSHRRSITDEKLDELMTANLKEINQQLPAYSQLNTYKLYNEEFEKTPKRSIKRFLYQ